MNKGSIYKLYNEYGTYFGSTIQSLNERFNHHKCKSSTTTSSKKLFQNGSIPKIQLIEEVYYDDIKELREREAYYIRNLECINIDIPFISEEEKKENQKEYRLKNKEHHKQWIEQNKEKIAQQTKKYYELNKDKIKQQNKKRNQKNKKVIEEKNKIKVTCQCGSVIRKGNLSQHKKSNKHLKYIEEINSNIII